MKFVTKDNSSQQWELLRFRFITSFWSRFLFSGFGTSSKFFWALGSKKTFNFIISNITVRKKGKRLLPFFAKL
ncbi:hypothetical protein LBK6_06875 [Leptospira borgpetersenii serovar Hardjo]|nr:hypothetical protein LBK6_06875 [Leptospira borgpetersenii serovar Hardjo]AMX61326.1 hypothetical protein LBK9_06900 [Leptospira borgpetersenii serovar Hardjo]AMX64571.1 hypothetical protein LBK30_06955 [Leptospira borgpetersenii serovar Hardjo]AMX67789.1 hypothetical protein LBHA_06820 [Leptospira borgpetersenii serovar Hardjo]AWV69949.1 hypothetical protein B9T54_07565 [Leptospira borgpetersenii serovar Hardjo-bovis]